MEYTVENFKENLTKIVDNSDFLELKSFTYDLLDCVYVDICCEKSNKIHKILVEGYQNEIKNSIEIFNPEHKVDIEVLENLLKEIDYFLEFTS
jgi:hypothetical protein